EEILARGVWNDHHREEGDQRGKQQAIDEDHEAGAFQVLEFGMRDFAVHLRQTLLAAHGEQRVAESDHHGNYGDRWRDGSTQPAEGFGAEFQIGGDGKRHGLVAVFEDRHQAPGDQDHDHYGGDLHDAQGFLAGFVDADDVFAPEINGD